MKSSSSKTIIQQQPAQGLSSIENLNVMMGLSVLAICLLILSHFLGNMSSKGKTANAAFATSRQKKRASRIGKKFVGRMKPTSITGFVQQPVGREINLQLSLKRNDTLFFPYLNQSVLVLGGAGCGKTVNSILPLSLSLLAQGSSMIYYQFKSVKVGEESEASKRVVATAFRMGYQIRIFAPGLKISGSFNVCDLVPDETDLTAAKEAVSIMALNLFENQQKAKDYFDKAGFEIASASLCFVRWIANVEGDPNLANLLMASQVLGLPHLGERLKHNQSKINPWTYDAFTKLTSIQSGSGTNKQQMGVIGSAQEVFGPLQSIDLVPVVAQPSNLPRFCPDDPLKVDGKHLIVCIVDKTRRSVTTPIIATFMHNICSYNLNGSTSRETPLAVVVDEADTVRVPQFLNWINQERSNGFCGIFGFQHLGQPPKAYGEGAARGFLSSCATKFWFNPGDFETAELLSKSLGEKEVVLKTASKSTTKGHVTRSTSETRHKVPLLTPDEILCLPKGKAVIQNPGVGNKDKSGIPYVHQFKYDERLEKEAEAADNALYDQIYQALEEAYQPPPPGYYEDLLKSYLEILDRLLPLPGKDVEESPNEVLTISGADLIRGLEIAKKSTTGVVPDRRYSVPPEVIEANGEVTLNAENCMKILGEKVYA